MTAGSTNRGLGTRAARLLALAAVLASGAATLPTTAVAFNPQPDPPGGTASESVSADRGDSGEGSIQDSESGSISDSEDVAIRDEENKSVQDSESAAMTDSEEGAGSDADAVAIRDSENPATS